MSLSIDGVWKSGVWAETVWADGVWYEGEPIIPPAPTPTFGGGIGHSSKPKRYYIERDGKRIFFTDESEVYDLLHQEEKRVVRKAKKAVKRVTKAQLAELVTFKDLDIPKPQIVLHFNDAGINQNIARINERINHNYMKALMKHVEEMEEEELFLELLFH